MKAQLQNRDPKECPMKENTLLFDLLQSLYSCDELAKLPGFMNTRILDNFPPTVPYSWD
ncbi:basal-body rod modification protein FlgD [Desmospora sp. 8437]|nr:basal-body rod modification protein FlgD [Desmospora sp. 8437]